MLDTVLAAHRKTILEALLQRTRRSGKCLVYTGGKGPGGYGWFTFKRDHGVYFMQTAHVAAYVLRHGRIPGKLHVLHECDQKFCIADEHLRLGTPAQNMADKVAKNRQTKGSEFKHSKLNEKKVRALRSAYESGSSMPTLAKRYGVTLQAIAYAIHRKTWKHVQ